MKLKLQPHEKILTTAVVLLLMVYCFYTGWYRPYGKKIERAKAALAKITINVNRAQTLQDKGFDYKTLESEAAAAEQQLPSVAKLPYLLGYIRDTFENNGVVLKNLSCTEGNSRPVDEPALEYRTAKISFSGTYSQIVTTLQSMENNDRGTLTISDLTLVKSDNALLNGSVVIGMFFEPAPPSSKDKPFMEETGKF